MRSLSIVLTPATLAVTFAATLALGLTACDKADTKDKTADKADDKNADADKADAKKAGDDKADDETDKPELAAAEDPEAGCIHEDEGAHEKKDGESCDHGNTVAATTSTGHFGGEFALTDTQTLASVLGAELPTEAVKVSGTVEAVCQAKGCWMVIKDGDKQARVLVNDHAFAIPFDGKGKAAVVEGTLEEKQLDEANVAHLKKDGDDTIKGEGPRMEYFLHATALDLS